MSTEGGIGVGGLKGLTPALIRKSEIKISQFKLK